MPEEKIVRKWRLQPGKMLLIDLEQGRIVEDEEIKTQLAAAEPYEEWLKATQFKLEELPDLPNEQPRRRPTIPPRCSIASRPSATPRKTCSSSWSRWRATGDDPVGSMGTDTPIAVLSKKPKLLYNYFKQNFAQVTNPPIDPIREELVMSLVSMIGPRPNLLGHQAGAHKRLEVSPAGADQRRCGEDPLHRRTGRRRVPHRDHRLHLARRRRRRRACERAASASACDATDAVLADNNILILSDRAVSPDRIPIPAALATAAVHHHLIRQGLRMQTGLVVETGEAREVHHFCVLAGYGAEAINPYLAFETLEQIRVQRGPDAQALRSAEELHQGDRQGHAEGDVQDGHLDLPVLLRRADFRRGRPVLRLRREIFHRHRHHDRRHRPARKSPRNACARHRDAYGDNPIYRNMLDVGGDYAFRLRGEDHAWTPESVSRLQHAVRGNNPAEYQALRRHASTSRASGC